MMDADLHDARRHHNGRGLTLMQLNELLFHSQSECAQCERKGVVFSLYTGGADPTIWLLCRTHHPAPSPSSIDLNLQYADFLRNPLGPTYSEHLAKFYDDSEWVR